MKNISYLLALLSLVILGTLPVMADDFTADFTTDNTSKYSSAATYGDKVVSMVITPEANKQTWWNSSDHHAWRFYNGGSFSLTVSSGYVVKSIAVTFAGGNGTFDSTTDNFINVTSNSSTIGSDARIESRKDNAVTTWTNSGGAYYGTMQVNFNLASSENSFYIKKIVVTYYADYTTTKAETKTTTTDITNGDVVWDFSKASSAWAETITMCGKVTTEWNHGTDNNADEYRPTTALTDATEYALPLVKGLSFTTKNDWALCLDYKNGQLWLGEGTTITIPGVAIGCYVVVSSSADFTFTNATEVQTKTVRAKSNGDVTLTAPAGGTYLYSLKVTSQYVSDVKQSWIFSTEEAHNGNNSHGVAKGQGGKLATDAANWTSSTSTEDGQTTVYMSANALNDAPLTVGGELMDEAAGIYFTTTAAGQVVVCPESYIVVDNSVNIRIPNVKAGSVITVRAASVSSADKAGFAERDQTNMEVLDDDNAIMYGENDFILTATKQGDVILQPSRGMKIYRIDIDPTVTVAYVNMTSTDDAGNVYYGYSGFKDLNDNARIKLVQRLAQNGTTTITAKLWNVQRNTKTTLDKYKAIKNENTANGTWAFEILDKEVATITSTNGNTCTVNAAKGGVTYIKATYTPASDETYCETYGFFELDVNDPQSFRIAQGETFSVNDVVALPMATTDQQTDNISPYKITDKNPAKGKDILCTLGGWAGETDVAREGNITSADAWSAGSKDVYVTTKDGFDYAISAKNSSSDEEGRTYITGLGSKTTADESTGGYDLITPDKVDVTPYKMPARGGFLKFEPQRDGTLTLYIHQNGATASVNVKVGDVTKKVYDPTTFHMRSYYVSDEVGKLFTQNNTADPDYNLTATTTGTLEMWTGSNGLLQNYETQGATDYASHKDEFDWFKTQVAKDSKNTTGKKLGELTSAEAGWNQGIYDHNGGQTAIQEAQSKYVFKVKAGKTYFVFTQGTRLGFFGFNFVPDATSTTDVQTVTLPDETVEQGSWTMPAIESGKYHKVSLNRTLTANQWNAVCLPFNLSERQVKEAFGNDCEVYDFDHTTDHAIVFHKHFYQMIMAGRPYIVWTSKSAFSNPDSYINFGSNAADQDCVVNDSQGDYQMVGFYAKRQLPQYAYYFTTDKNYFVKQKTADKVNYVKGYRAYIYGTTEETRKAKRLVVSIDGVDEGVETGIDDIAYGCASPAVSGTVYSLSGVKVGDIGLQGFPKGVYIMNGRKYVVK